MSSSVAKSAERAAAAKEMTCLALSNSRLASDADPPRRGGQKGIE
jgi:hypothetical protein